MVVKIRGDRAKGIAFLLGLLVLVMLPTLAGASSSKVAISARSLARMEDQHLVIAKGNVEIRYQDVVLTAQEVKLHTDTKDLVATGNVVLKENKGSLSCDKLEFNLDTKKGVAMRARGFFSPFYYLQGREIKKVGTKKYVVEHGSFTTCKSCVEHPNKAPDWSFKSSHMEVELGKSATIHNMSGWIKKIPVIYAPYLKIPLQNERKTGFLIPRVGYSKTKGAFVKIPFYWAISPYQDATFTLIPYSEGTIRGKVEYRYNLETGKGFLSYDYIRKESERTQWSLLYNHDQRLPYGWRLLANADVQSDNEYKKEDQSNFERRSQRYSDSFVVLSKSWGNNYLSAEFRHKEDLLYLVFFSSLPSFWYLLLTALLFYLGALASNHGEEIWGEEDSPSIVIDEVVGFLIAMVGISPSFWSVVLGFLLFRFWDIWKPFQWIEELPGGWGVMADDALAGIVTCIMLHFMV